MLFDSKDKNYYRYQVYLDNDIGMKGPIQKYLIKTTMDEDC
jgi:hypothetical protein